ncbi:MAG: hypothetical protein QM766_04310 [Burkholderiaceae bacterium]
MQPIVMRTTIDLDPQLHALVRRRAQREGLSLGRMLGKLVEQGMQQGADTADEPVLQRSGRFIALMPATQGAKVASATVQQVIDEEGLL